MTTPTSAVHPGVPAPASAAWLSAIRAEHVAGYGYGTLGPRLANDQHVTLARACEQAHQALAATAQQFLATPAPTDTSSLGDFQLPLRPTDDASAQQLAIQLESACASAWRYVLAQLSDQLGNDADPATAWTAAVTALSATAVRAVQWRRLTDPSSSSVAFPGI